MEFWLDFVYSIIERFGVADIIANMQKCIKFASEK